MVPRTSVLNPSLPSLTPFATRASNPGSKIGITPELIEAIWLSSLSTQVTLIPKSAKQAPETSPTYPVPITAMCIASPILRALDLACEEINRLLEALSEAYSRFPAENVARAADVWLPDSGIVHR